MNKGNPLSHRKHRQAYGHDVVGRHVKLHLERIVNAPARVRRPRAGL